VFANWCRCGSEVCNDHYRFQAKLSINANFDPVNGIWARICYKCHQSRIGFMQSLGVMRRRTSSFIDLRTVNVAKSLMEVNKAEIRLKKVK
jgi:rabenosyn-5